MPVFETSAIDIFLFRRESGRILFLLLQRVAQEDTVGQWHVVEGQANANELPAETVLREVTANTGLEVSALWALPSVHTCYEVRRNCILLKAVFAAEVTESTVTLADGYQKARWITADQAMDLLRAPGHREGLRHILEDVLTARDRGSIYRVEMHEQSRPR